MTCPLSAEDVAQRVTEIVDDHAEREGPLLLILHDVQETYGYVPAEALKIIAEKLNLSRAEVHGVVSFYHDYRHEPAGRHVLRLCRAEACQSMGGERLADRVRELLGLDWHETSPDGAITLEPVFCLGLCASAPAATVDGRLVARLDDERLEDVIREVRA